MFGLWKYNLYGGQMCNSDGIVMDESFELSVRAFAFPASEAALSRFL
jgi:hypothetical protein